jgi:hypothetical protein
VGLQAVQVIFSGKVAEVFQQSFQVALVRGRMLEVQGGSNFELPTFNVELGEKDVVEQGHLRFESSA